MLGFVFGVFPVWMIVGNIVSVFQGAPFLPGDTVCILSGRHKGKITKVNQVWKSRGQIVVNLSTESKTYRDNVYCNVAVFKIAKNKLQRDQRLFIYNIFIFVAIILGLGIINYVENYSGLDEQEFYTRYSLGFDLTILLGLSLIASFIYGVKKLLDINPSIQLRRKSVDELKKILNDPDYEQWHTIPLPIVKTEN